MRKTFFFLLITLLSLQLSACSKNSKQTVDMRSIISNNNMNSFISEDEEYIYFVDFTTVKKLSKSDQSVTDLYTFPSDSSPLTGFEYFKDHLYMITAQQELVSMNTSGKELSKNKLPLAKLQEDPSYVFSSYIFADHLYYISTKSKNVYEVNTNNLTFTKTDPSVTRQFTEPDNTLFIKKLENNWGKLYVQRENKETLFTLENEHVLLNQISYDSNYIFYISSNINTPNEYVLHRIDINGENRKEIKRLEMTIDNINVKYDHRFIYVYMGDNNFAKIDKNTLEETSLSFQENIDSLNYEIANELFFFHNHSFFIDSNNKKKTNL